MDYKEILKGIRMNYHKLLIIMKHTEIIKRNS